MITKEGFPIVFNLGSFSFVGKIKVNVCFIIYASLSVKTGYSPQLCIMDDLKDLEKLPPKSMSKRLDDFDAQMEFLEGNLKPLAISHISGCSYDI